MSDAAVKMICDTIAIGAGMAAYLFVCVGFFLWTVGAFDKRN